MMSSKCPKIKCEAIKYNGVIYEGESHCEIGLKMVRDGICERYPSGDAQGFIDEEGTFRNRYQALRMAAHNGQVEWGKTVNKDELFSEDLKK